MIVTGYKEFDRAANGEGGLITHGNVISDSMYGFHVRAYNETECNGHRFAPGELQRFDLKSATEGYGHRFEPVRRWIEASEHFKHNSGWCYLIRHATKEGCVVIHGALVTDYQNRLLAEFSRGALDRHSDFASGTRKSHAVMGRVKPLLLNLGGAA